VQIERERRRLIGRGHRRLLEATPELLRSSAVS
jgi:hypothetical protein